MITLICGLPRSGKTTYSKIYEDTCKVFHFDYYGSYIYGSIKRYKEKNPDKDIVVEGVYNMAMFRRTLIAPYKDEKTVCIWLDTPKEIKQNRPGYSKHCEYEFEPPTYDEGWDEIIVIR